MKVSVIMPVFNTAKYLEKSLSSLINQTLKDIEIICVDDGSSDNSLEVLKNFAQKDSRIKVFSQKNQGQSVARNAGIRVAKGDYIGFLDSDDWADEKMFEKLYNNAVEYGSDIAMCSINLYDDVTGEMTDNDSYLTLDLFPENFDNRAFSYEETLGFIFRVCVVPWNKIFKRDFLNKNNIFFPEGLFFEDNVFNLETFLKSEKISLTREHLVYYRRFSKTSTTTGDDIKKLDFFEILDLQEKLLKETGVYGKVEEYFQESKRNTLKYWYKKLQDENIKKKYFEKLKQIYPDIEVA